MTRECRRDGWARRKARESGRREREGAGMAEEGEGGTKHRRRERTGGWRVMAR